MGPHDRTPRQAPASGGEHSQQHRGSDHDAREGHLRGREGAIGDLYEQEARAPDSTEAEEDDDPGVGAMLVHGDLRPNGGGRPGVR